MNGLLLRVRFAEANNGRKLLPALGLNGQCDWSPVRPSCVEEQLSPGAVVTERKSHGQRHEKGRDRGRNTSFLLSLSL